MSRINSVRSNTRIPSLFSRAAPWAGERSSSNTTRLAFTYSARARNSSAFPLPMYRRGCGVLSRCTNVLTTSAPAVSVNSRSSSRCSSTSGRKSPRSWTPTRIARSGPARSCDSRGSVGGPLRGMGARRGRLPRDAPPGRGGSRRDGGQGASVAVRAQVRAPSQCAPRSGLAERSRRPGRPPSPPS